MAFDFIEGGCDDEIGLRKNEAAFEAYQLLPRYLVDVSKFELATTLAGQEFALPVGIAPTGAAGIFRHDGDRELARAAAAANVPFVMSANSNGSLEEAAAVAPEHTWFQLYGLKELVGDSRQGATGGRRGDQGTRLIRRRSGLIQPRAQSSQRILPLVARDALNGAAGSDASRLDIGILPQRRVAALEKLQPVCAARR